MALALATYEPRDPSRTVLYTMIADHLETFLASCEAAQDATGWPADVQHELYDYLQRGILAHGFLRLGCDTCKHEVLLPFSCKRRGFCPSCAGRRMAQTAAHLVERVIPWVSMPLRAKANYNFRSRICRRNLWRISSSKVGSSSTTKILAGMYGSPCRCGYSSYCRVLYDRAISRAEAADSRWG